MNLTEIQNTLLDARIKGIPGSVEPFPLKEIKNKNWNILNEDLPMPIMVLKQDQLNHNLNQQFLFHLSFELLEYFEFQQQKIMTAQLE